MVATELKGLTKELGSKIPSVVVGDKRPLNDPFVDKMKRWLLIGLTAVIGGGAIILIIIRVIGKFF